MDFKGNPAQTQIERVKFTIETSYTRHESSHATYFNQNHIIFFAALLIKCSVFFKDKKNWMSLLDYCSDFVKYQLSPIRLINEKLLDKNSLAYKEIPASTLLQ